MTYSDFKFVPTPKWEMLLARLLGKKVTGVDGDCAVTAYEWRGKIYIVDAD